jgi:predicted dithiol-disulfide oxidoreductase (DUF899 family)
MALPKIVSRDEWLAARRELLVREKAHTRQMDALNADRRRLPMVRIDKDYRFTGPEGEVSFADLFAGKRQLILQHVMFHPDWENACGSCTASVEEISPATIRHLESRDTAFVLASRAAQDKIAGYKERRGWNLPWYSTLGSDFNYDFDVTLDSGVRPPVYNFHPVEWDVEPGTGREQPGLSCFLRDGGEIYHTNSTFARGTDQLGGAYTFLDLTALGRQEDWEEPKDRVEKAHDNTPDFS